MSATLYIMRPSGASRAPALILERFEGIFASFDPRIDRDFFYSPRLRVVLGQSLASVSRKQASKIFEDRTLILIRFQDETNCGSVLAWLDHVGLIRFSSNERN